MFFCSSRATLSIQGIDDFLEDTNPASEDLEAGSLADGSGQSLFDTRTATTHDKSDFGAEDTSDNGRRCLENVKLIDNDNGNTENNDDDRELQVSASSHVNTDSNTHDDNYHDVTVKLMTQFSGMFKEESNNVNENTINESPLEVAVQGLSPQSGDDNNKTFDALPANDTFSGGAVTAGADADDSHEKAQEQDSVEIAGGTKIATVETDKNNNEHDPKDDNHNGSA